MGRVRDAFLNGLLASLVILSIGLSVRVWFPSEPSGVRSAQPNVQVTPPSEQGTKPVTLRPERIYVRNKTGTVALLPAGSMAYLRVWNGMQDVLMGMSALPAPQQSEAEMDSQAETITLMLPIPLTVERWAQEWRWNTAGLRNFSMKVDRITLRFDKTPLLHLSGPGGGVYRIGPVSPIDAQMIKDLMANLEPTLFVKYRPLNTKDLSVRAAAGLQVPEISDVPAASLEVRKPDNGVEEARYLPDLTVVRQIDEKDARSFTDGQRLLRITTAGHLEYMSVHTAGSPIAPDINSARSTAKDWVYDHGGWPQDLVMWDFVQQPGSSVLVFDLRMNGVYPVESAGGALRVHVTTYRDASNMQHSTVTQFRRLPEFVPHFGRARQPIITPERALELVAGKFGPLLSVEEVRDIHPAYLIRLTAKGGGDWVLEPTWVVQVGEERIYVQASYTVTDSESFEPFSARP